MESPVIVDPTEVDWKRALIDPAFFAWRFLGIKPHPGQRRWLRAATERENLLVTGNRWGKSYASAMKLIHRAVFQIRDLKYDRAGRFRAAIGSISQDQANLMFSTVIRLMRQSPAVASSIRSVTRTPYPRLTLQNGATIDARTTQNRGEYLLGNDYDLFIFDEVAFETDPEYVVEEVIMMRLADRAGQLDLVSTPNGKNWFYRRACEVEHGKRPGYFQNGDSRENTHISRDFLDERVRYFTDTRLAQNIRGQFVDSGGEVLQGSYIDRALAKQIDLPADSSRVQYISGWDLARKATATVGVTIAIVDGVAKVVALERLKNFDWNIVVDRVARRQRRFPGRLVVDGTGLGDVVIAQLADYNPEPFIFSEARKSEMLTNVELFHARGNVAYDRWELPDGPGRVWSLEDELREARWDDNNRCDALMALGLALWPLRRRDTPVIAPRVARL